MTSVTTREVIDKACANFRNGLGPDDRMDFDAVLRERFPVRGTGGVAMANARTQARIRSEIAEFYEPASTEY